MGQFYRFLGEKRTGKVRVAVMDMWRPFRNSTRAHAPQAAILFDKFHVIRHPGEALDKVRKHEYALLPHPQNLAGTARTCPLFTAHSCQTFCQGGQELL